MIVALIVAELVVAVTSGSAASVSPSPTTAASQGPGSGIFTAGSYWNTPFRADAPVDRDSPALIGFLRDRSRLDYVRLAGLSSTGAWGMPIYHATGADPLVAVTKSCPLGGDGVLRGDATLVRMPPEAGGASDVDAAALVYSANEAIAYMELIRTSSTTATACGSSIYYTDSNGLEGSLPQSDQPLNRGHRGLPGPTFAVTWGEIQAGRIDHRLKIAVPASSTAHVWPMTGSDGDSTNPSAIPQGAAIRIKPSVDLGSLGLSPAALTVARALRRYGAVVGDTSGASVILKVENTVAEGKGWLWQGLLGPDSLKAIPLSAFQVVELGYRP